MALSSIVAAIIACDQYALLPHEQIVVGTLGKLKSWASKRQLQFKAMRIMVFDEADEMLKADGFADDSIRMIRDITKQSADCQVCSVSQARC